MLLKMSPYFWHLARQYFDCAQYADDASIVAAAEAAGLSEFVNRHLMALI